MTEENIVELTDLSFDKLNIKESLLRGVYAYGFEKPSLIQSASWPLIMKGINVFGIAKTGSGKTLAFTLPFLAKYKKEDFSNKKIQPLMVCVAPTKELAQQIAEVTSEFGSMSGMVTHCVIGGTPKY